MAINFPHTALQACVCLLLVSHTLADPKPTTVEIVLERALAESPAVKEIESHSAARRGAGVATATIENPTLDSEVRIPVAYDESRGSDEVTVSLSQPLRVSDFGARDRVNSLIQSAANTDQKVALLEFSQRLRLAYAKSWALERRLGQLKKFLDRAAALEGAVKRATESGYLGAGEGYLFKAEALKARYQVRALESDVARARAELSKNAGFAVQGALSSPTLSPLPEASALVASPSEISSQSRAALAVKLANEQLRLAELDAFPKFSPRLVYERTGDSADYVGLGISVDLPFFNRNRGERDTRAAEVAAARSLEVYLGSEGFKTELTALLDSIAASTRLVSGYETEIVPTLREALTAEERFMSAGQGSLFRVWQVLRELTVAEEEIVERSVKLHADRAELAVLSGRDL